MNYELNLRVVVLQKTLEMKGTMDAGWVEAQMADLRQQDEYRRAKASIESVGDELRKVLEDILRDCEGPIQ